MLLVISRMPAVLVLFIVLFCPQFTVRWSVVCLFQDNFAIYRIDQQLRELSSMLPEYSVDGFDNCIEDDDDDDDEDYVDDGVFDNRLVWQLLYAVIFYFCQHCDVQHNSM